MRLNNEALNLPNNRIVQYSRMTVPCCYECNQELQRYVEGRVSAAVKIGYSAVRDLHPTVLFFWLGKMYYALRYRELFQLGDPGQPEKGPIVSEEAMRDLLTLHCLLQGVRGSLIAGESTPWSVVLCRTKEHDNESLNFDYRDGRHLEAIALRIRSVGLIFTFGDHGFAKACVQDLTDAAEGRDLSRIQFAELQAQMWYAAHLRSRAYDYYFSFGGGVVRYRLLDNASNQMDAMYFDEWDDKQYAEFLSSATGYPVEFLYKPRHLIRRFIKDNDGNFIMTTD